MTTPTPAERELADHELLMAAPCNGAGFRHPFATVAQADAELSVYEWQLRQRGAYSPTLMGERAAELASLLPKTEAARLLDQYALATLAQAEREDAESEARAKELDDLAHEHYLDGRGDSY